MAVYTEVSRSELAHFLGRFEAGELVAFSGIKQGIENTNYRVKTTTGTFVLTLFERRVAENDLPFFLALMAHLDKNGVPCPAPIADKSGATLFNLNGRPTALFPFLPGDWPKTVTADHCRTLGAVLARFHLATATLEQFRANGLSVRHWRSLLEASRQTAEELQPGLAAAMLDELEELEIQWPEHLPSGVIHADLFPDNVFFEDGKIVGLLDFTFACNDLLAYDLAICLNAWCFEKYGEFNLNKARSLKQGYEAVRPLTDAENAALPLLCRAAAMRFFATRLYDWRNTPDGPITWRKDPLECWNQLLAHRKLAGKAGETPYL